MHRPRRSVFTLAVACVLALAAVASTVGGPWEMEDRSFDLVRVGPPADRRVGEASPGEPPDLEQPEPAPPPDLGWMRTLAVVVIVLVVVAFVAWLAIRFSQGKVAAPVGSHSAGVYTEPEPELPVLRRGVETARQLLAEGGEPGDSIISAWLALESAAADSGVKRAPSQTPTEFAVAVMGRTQADPEATRTLLRLYRRARFSDSPSTIDDVEEAVACLQRLAESWDLMVSSSRMGR